MSNIGKRFGVCFLAATLLIVFGGVAKAQHGQMQGHGGMDMSSHESGSHSMSTKDRPVQSVSVEGYKISLDVMDMSMHMSMPGMKGTSMQGADHSKSHAIMVTVQDTASKEIISDAKVNYTIISPSGEKETGKLEWSGDRYDGTFSPKGKGAYQVQLTIENGGMEREANFTYKL